MLISGLVIGEFTARIVGWPQPYSALYVYDKTLGYRTPSNKKVSYAIGKQMYSVSFDQDGIVDRAGKSEADIVILGDGISAGLELQTQDRLAHQLSRLLGSVSVINLSVTGYGTIQQALLLEEWLALHKIHPKKVILVFNLSSDVIDNVREWDSDSVPGISLANRDGLILSPILPNMLYRNTALLYRESKLAGYLSNLKNRPISNYIPIQINNLFAFNLSDEMKYALLGTNSGFEKLKKLSNDYKFGLYGIVWVDCGLFGNIENESLLNAVKHIRQLTTGIIWNQEDSIECDKTIKNWDDNVFVTGTRHFNSKEMARFAVKMSDLIQKND